MKSCRGKVSFIEKTQEQSFMLRVWMKEIAVVLSDSAVAVESIVENRIQQKGTTTECWL